MDLTGLPSDKKSALVKHHFVNIAYSEIYIQNTQLNWVYVTNESSIVYKMGTNQNK